MRLTTLVVLLLMSLFAPIFAAYFVLRADEIAETSSFVASPQMSIVMGAVFAVGSLLPAATVFGNVVSELGWVPLVRIRRENGASVLVFNKFHELWKRASIRLEDSPVTVSIVLESANRRTAGCIVRVAAGDQTCDIASAVRDNEVVDALVVFIESHGYSVNVAPSTSV